MAIAVTAAVILILTLAVALDGTDQDSAEDGRPESSLRETIAGADERLDGLDSYRYESALEVELPGAGGELGATAGSVTASGGVIPPDRVHHIATTTLGGISAEEELIRLPEGEFIKRSDGYTEGLGELNTFLLSVPSLWSEIAAVAQLLPEDPAAAADTVSGIEVTRYTADEVRLLLVKDYVLRLFGAVESAEALPDFYVVRFWVSEEGGRLLRLEIEGEGLDPQGGTVTFLLEAEISDIGADFAIELE